ncbi:hypothetical protein [Pontiella sulfatireligans]|uniref:hypothetical protein n=1 Tax=Pontiella sulfatireligans TaxID=2750658 RepID=UPI00109C0B60|nr:hypothetical protein [Pontiella sulfatireligans]
METGEIAHVIYETSVGVFAIALSFLRKNDRSNGSSFIRKYNKQLLLLFGIAMLIHGTHAFIKYNKTTEKNPNQPSEVVRQVRN